MRAGVRIAERSKYKPLTSRYVEESVEGIGGTTPQKRLVLCRIKSRERNEVRTVSLYPYTGGQILIYTIMRKGTLVKYRAPGWENKIGKVYSVNGDRVMVEFGKHDFVEFYSDELIVMSLL